MPRYCFKAFPRAFCHWKGHLQSQAINPDGHNVEVVAHNPTKLEKHKGTENKGDGSPEWEIPHTPYDKCYFQRYLEAISLGTALIFGFKVSKFYLHNELQQLWEKSITFNKDFTHIFPFTPPKRSFATTFSVKDVANESDQGKSDGSLLLGNFSASFKEIQSESLKSSVSPASSTPPVTRDAAEAEVTRALDDLVRTAQQQAALELHVSALQQLRHASLADALPTLRRAANMQHAPAQYNLALCYELGLGVLPDVTKARILYEKASNQGHKEAASRLQALPTTSAHLNTCAPQSSPGLRSTSSVAPSQLTPAGDLTTHIMATLSGNSFSSESSTAYRRATRSQIESCVCSNLPRQGSQRIDLQALNSGTFGAFAPRKNTEVSPGV